MENPNNKKDFDHVMFNESNLDKTTISISCLEIIKNKEIDDVIDVIIDLHLFYKKGNEGAKRKIYSFLREIFGVQGKLNSKNTNIYMKDYEGRGIKKEKTEFSDQYVFARLSVKEIYQLVKKNDEYKEVIDSTPPIYRIWNDFDLEKQIDKSRSTIKADAAHVSFNALGERIVWAVADSGIDGSHPHFEKHNNLDLPEQLDHYDFTQFRPVKIPKSKLTDKYGHGTHVAGIIAGEVKSTKKNPLRMQKSERDSEGNSQKRIAELPEGTHMCGMAPKCKLLSLKVLDDNGDGKVSDLIAAIGYIQKINNNGRYLHIHGVNMSIGHRFDAEWFACGQSPLCVEVNRLVRSGVVVVVAAGNTGYGAISTNYNGVVEAGINLTINDPGNADMAITVGSTHRDMPHIYGVSYFSSKGPTGDGRLKPDLVAPGEKIVSCAANQHKDSTGFSYKEESGTSMAAPHVSGAIAAFLSIRREFINQPEVVKEIFTSTTTDLKREKYFQGHGLIDLMRGIQSV